MVLGEVSTTASVMMDKLFEFSDDAVLQSHI
jgi:hypothetical protein